MGLPDGRATPEGDGLTGATAVAGSREGASLKVDDLTVAIRRPTGVVRPVRGISFSVSRGERVALVGESGSGKSLTALSIMRLLPADIVIESGQITVDGSDIRCIPERKMGSIRGRTLAMISQDALSALNPIQTVGRQLTEGIRLKPRLASRAQATDQAERLLDEVGIPNARQRLRSYPHELSGGMRQRVAIAIALAREPQILIADEATTALDVTTQALVLDLLESIVAQRNLSVIMITHDLGVAARFCDQVHVMYAGRIVEKAPAERFFAYPRHPYSRGLLRAVCRTTADVTQPLPMIGGRPPMFDDLPRGCPFSPRCTHTTSRCECEEPSLRTVGTNIVACIHAEESGEAPWDES